MKQYFFITTFGSIYNKALPLIEEKKSDGEVIIVTANKNIQRFFTHIGYKVIFLDFNANIFSRKQLYYIPFRLYAARYYYNEYFAHVFDSKVYFFGSGWTIGIFSIIQKMAKSNIVFQYPSDQSPTIWDYVDTFKTRILKRMVKILTKVDVDVVTDTGMLSFNLNEKFYKNNNIIIIREELDKNLLIPVMEIFSYDETVLIATEDVIKYDRVDRKEFLSKMNAVLNIICETKGFNYKVKPHPNEPRTYGLFPSDTIIPAYIPSEFIMMNKWKYIIGLESLTLIKAAQLTDAKVISLIDFIDYKKRHVARKFKSWQQRESNNILFPKNEEELRKVLS